MKNKVLILGGAGVTGRLILQHLQHLQLDITIGSRSLQPVPFPDQEPETVKQLNIDIRDEQDAIEKIAQFTLVIIAIGPFKTYGSLAHLLCIKAGVHCIDVNDEVETAIAIYELDAMARQKNVCVLTGMGLNPGLMTYMAQCLMDKAGPGPKDIYLRLFVGGKQDAGYAAVHVMLEGFTREVAAISEGRFSHISCNDKRPAINCVFPGMEKALQAMHCSTPQAYTFTRNSRFKELRSLDFRIHFQGMSLWMVNLLRNSSWLKKERVRNRLASFIFKQQHKMKHRKGNVPDSIALVQCSSLQGTAAAFCTGMTSYEMTARFAAVVTELFITGNILKQPGVTGIEDAVIDDHLLPHVLQTKQVNIFYTGL